jgi:hypothetical protein
VKKWDDHVPGCFGTADRVFARHAADEDRAFVWLTDLRTRGVGWTEARAQLKAFLDSEKFSPADIKEQLARAKSKMKPWLRD